MPLYFFDVDDGDRSTTDDTGLDLTSFEDAKRKAVAVLPEIARDVLPDGDRRVMAVNVRDENGRALVSATLTLEVRNISPELD